MLKGKIALVTGSTSGIGLGLAQALAAQGATLITNGFGDADAARKTIADAAARAGHPVAPIGYHGADMSRASEIEAMMQYAETTFGGVDILVNNAGLSMRAMFAELDLKVLKELMDINFWGTVYMTKYALPSITRNKGTVAGISSIAGYRGLPARTGYSASKFAMQGFLEALRTELLHSGVNVMWASPGFTASNIRNVALGADGGTQKETPLDEAKLMSAETCARIIFKGIENRKRSVVMTTQGKATVWLNKLFPAWMDKKVFSHFAAEPGSPLKK